MYWLKSWTQAASVSVSTCTHMCIQPREGYDPDHSGKLPFSPTWLGCCSHQPIAAAKGTWEERLRGSLALGTCQAQNPWLQVPEDLFCAVEEPRPREHSLPGEGTWSLSFILWGTSKAHLHPMWDPSSSIPMDHLPHLEPSKFSQNGICLVVDLFEKANVLEPRHANAVPPF